MESFFFFQIRLFLTYRKRYDSFGFYKHHLLKTSFKSIHFAKTYITHLLLSSVSSYTILHLSKYIHVWKWFRELWAVIFIRQTAWPDDGFESIIVTYLHSVRIAQFCHFSPWLAFSSLTIWFLQCCIVIITILHKDLSYV